MNDITGAMIVAAIGTLAIAGLAVDCNIKPDSIKYAEEVCLPNEGLQFISEGLTRFSEATCNNGAVFEYDNSELSGDK